MSAASSTVLLNGPLWLKGVWERNASGRVAAATRPYVALKPYTPQKEAGMRIDPPASEPCATARGATRVLAYGEGRARRTKEQVVRRGPVAELRGVGFAEHYSSCVL